MSNKVHVGTHNYFNPRFTLNQLLPKLVAIRVLMEAEDSEEKWTHAQRRRFNFVIQSLLDDIVKIIESDIVPKAETSDVGDIPF